MSLVEAKNLTKSYSHKLLLDHVDFSISTGQKIALVAQNGAGKSTLLGVITGEVDISDGTIKFQRGLRIGFLSQKNNLDPQKTVIDFLFSSDDPVVKAIKSYESILSNPNFDQNELNKILDQIDTLKAWEYEHKINIIISRLNITPFLNQKCGSLSGGEAKRVALAKVLVEESDLLIMDEPTNHLDLEMIEWLENYLSKNDKTLLLVTHDRYFLERVCNEIWELDRGNINKFNGNYSYFLEKKAEREEMEKIELHKLKQYYKRELSRMRRGASGRGTKSNYRQDRFVDIKDELEFKKHRQQFESMSLGISMEERRLGSKILNLKNINKKFGEKIILKDFNHEFKHGERIGIIGKNGVGKSTFVNLLMENEPIDSGLIGKGETIIFGHYHQKDIEFPEGKRIIDVVRDVSEFMIMGDGEKVSASLLLEKFLFPANAQYVMANSLSGGEKRRLHLLTILMKNPNFLILDEPTNDLDLITLGVLEDFLLQYKGCLIVISHDRFFMDKIVDNLFVFEGNGVVKDFYGTYMDYLEETKNKSDKKEQKKINLETQDPKPEKKKLSYMEKREYETLEKEIEQLSKRKNEINTLFDDTTLSYEEINKLSEELGDIVKNLSIKEERWFELSEKVE